MKIERGKELEYLASVQIAQLRRDAEEGIALQGGPLVAALQYAERCAEDRERR